MGYKQGKPREELTIGSLEEILGPDHPVRLMDLLVEEIVPHLEEGLNQVGHSAVGASAYDRTSLLKLLIYGYQNRIQSSRSLERETHRNLEVIWLMKGLRPDHKTISDFRKCHGPQIRQALRQFNWFLKQQGYLEGKRVSIDGMKTKANTNRDTLSEEKIDKRIDKRLSAIDRQITQYIKQLELNDAVTDKQENLEVLALKEAGYVEQIARLQAEIQDLLKKKEAVVNNDKKHVNLTDPDAPLIKSRNGHMPQYNVQSSVCNKHKLIVTTYVSSQANDKQHLEPMVERSEQSLEVIVSQVHADSDYYAIEPIEKLTQAGKEVYVAVSQSGQKKVLDQQGQPVRFIYDTEQDMYRCSQGQELRLLSRGVIKHGRRVNQYRSKDCSGCALRSACTTSKIGRSIYRYENAQWWEAYKRKMSGPLGKAMLHQRRCSVEHPFGTIRSVLMGHIPLLLRGREKAQTEIDLYHMAYNFKRVCNIAGVKVLRYQIQQYDWAAAAQAIKRADEQLKRRQKQKKAG